MMCNAIFIDFKTLLENNSLRDISVQALKNVIRDIGPSKVICLNTDVEMQDFNYDMIADKLSQALVLKKSMFFEALHSASWSEVPGKVASWMSVNEVKSFTIVLNEQVPKLNEMYANNIICCKQLSEAEYKTIVWTMSNFKSPSSDDMFFVSDTHFGHKNIVKYCNRPWNSGRDSSGEIIVTDDDVKRMDNEMVKRWNAVVSKDATVWHLGDFSFGGKETAERIFPQLNGKINLVMGNHDHRKVKWYYDLGFHRVYDRRVIINDFVILTHAPLMFLNENCPFYQVFGHVHDSSAYQTWSKTGCCVCVERHDYTPVPWKTIKAKYEELNGREDGI